MPTIAPASPAELPDHAAAHSSAPSRLGELPVATAYYALMVFALATVLASVDTQLLVLLTDPIKASLLLSDTQIGLLQGAGLVLIAGLAAVPVGWLADRFDRRVVLAVFIVVWSGAAAVCGLAESFGWFFVAAVGLGIGKAGVKPVVFALIPEVFSERQRVTANSVYALVALLGAGVGIGLAGVLLEKLGGLRAHLPASMHGTEVWRLAFFVVAMAGPVVALLMVGVRKRRGLAGAEPPDAAAAAAAQQGAGDYVRNNIGAVAGVFGMIGFAGMGVGAVQSWLPVAATRQFGAAPAEVGQALGLVIMTATLLGAAVGTLAIRWLQPRLGLATPMRVVGWGLMMAAAASLALPAAQAAWHLYVIYVVFATPMIAATVLLPTLIQDISQPRFRSRVTAIGLVLSTLIATISPILVGIISDALKSWPNGLMVAVAGVSFAGMAIGALVARLSEPSFVRTVEALREDAPA